MATDRRLSAPGHRPKDDARKMIFLEAADGVSILGYSGLGATMKGTEPSDRMSAVLRGRKLPLEQCLSTLAGALRRELPSHMPRDLLSEHHVIVPSFVNDEPRLYAIQLALSPDRREQSFRWHRIASEIGARPPRIALSGSGSPRLLGNRLWVRELLRLVRKHEQGRISALAVADFLAATNLRVSASEPTVGASCIVAWRYSKGGPKKGGGGHHAYSGNARVGTPMLPIISGGMDVAAIAKVLMEHAAPQLKAALEAGVAPESVDRDLLNKALARLPHQPDEKLR